VKVGSRKSARLNPVPEMPGGEDGEDATEVLRQMREQMQARDAELQEMRDQMHALQAGAAANAAAAPQPAGIPMRFGLDSVQKFKSSMRTRRKHMLCH
jgi:hypothetical protein